MNNRKRKKWLKKHNKYISDNELWSFDYTICEWIVPRLKKFKEVNCAYPGVEPMDTPEKWDEALDKMIRAFELAKYDPIDLDENLKPNYEYDFSKPFDMDKYKEIYDKWKNEVDEGMMLFATWFTSLWI